MNKKSKQQIENKKLNNSINSSSSDETDSDTDLDFENEDKKNKKILKNKKDAKTNETPNDQTSQKKRGRPKKAIVNKQPQKTNLPIKEKEPEEEQLILCIPNFDDSDENSENNETDKRNMQKDNSSEGNMFTMECDSDNEDIFKKESIKLLDSLTDTENVNESEESNEYDTKTLLFEIKKRDQIIKKLKLQLTTQKPVQTNDMLFMFTRDVVKKLIDLKLFDMSNNNSPIVIEKTNIACWHCTYNFDTLPCFIPDRYVNGKFYVFGCFCSYSCAMKYNRSLGDYRVETRRSLILDLCNTIFGSTQMCVEAYDKEVLEKFGGPMTIDQFRDNNLICKKEYKLNIPPVIPLVATIEERMRETHQYSRSKR